MSFSWLKKFRFGVELHYQELEGTNVMILNALSHSFLSPPFSFDPEAAVAAVLKKPRRKNQKKRRWKSEEAAAISLEQVTRVAVIIKGRRFIVEKASIVFISKSKRLCFVLEGIFRERCDCS